MKARLARGSVVAAVAVWMSACGGGGAADRVPPALVATEPGAGAESVDIDTPVVLVFSEPLDPRSLTTEAIQVDRIVPSLARGDADSIREPVAGALRYDPDAYTVTFEAVSGLALGARYEVEATTSIRDRAGNALTATEPVAFATRTGRLAGAGKVGVDPGPFSITDLAGPYLAMAASGDAFLVWSDPLVAAIPHGVAW